ncbi:MAG: hypothetical protein IIB21_05810, partial [Chloroflexi bacterium]|nr:hypothetical protein [Chloroflexota bacterium]
MSAHLAPATWPRRLLATLSAAALLAILALTFGATMPKTAQANPLTGVASIAAGGSHTCALTTAGVLKCWGINTFGRLGEGTIGGIRPTPVDVVGLTGVASIAAGGSHTCALTTAGGAKCWGSNSNGQVGDGTI